MGMNLEHMLEGHMPLHDSMYTTYPQKVSPEASTVPVSLREGSTQKAPVLGVQNIPTLVTAG